MLGLAVAALLAFAPSAFASTLTESGSTVTWTAASGIANNTTFVDSPTDITIQTADDPVTYAGSEPSASCTDTDGTAGDGSADQVTCATPPITRVVANSEDLDDTEYAAGVASHNMTINGGDAGDSIYGGAQDDQLNGDTGNDYIEGRAGSDAITGGDGDDSLFGLDCCSGPSADGNDSISGGNGSDYGAGGPGDDSIDLGAGDDNGAAGGPGNDNISGGDGNDSTIYGGPGDDRLSGGPGNEDLYGDCGGTCGAGAAGNDTIDAGDGNDWAAGEAGNDSIDMGAGDDQAFGDCSYSSSCNSGSPGDDVIQGGDGVDELRGQLGNDTVDGGAGNDDRVVGGPGNDTVRGGDGDDQNVAGDAGTDNVDGGSGEDVLVEYDDGSGVTAFGPDVVHGGPGFDVVEWYTGCSSNDTLNVSLDDQANDSFMGGPGGCTGEDDPNNNFGSDIEQLEVNAGSTPVIAVGSSAANVIYTGSAPDTVDPGSGPDTVGTFGGPDTVNAVDGFPDFIDCGDGSDTANVDQFDTTVRCETVNRSSVASAYQVPEDAAPQLSWMTPAPGSHGISSSVATTLEVAAVDDKGISKVEFYVGSRLVCTATAAPYRCSYLPQGIDLGRNTLTAIAYDTAGQTASALNQVLVPRFVPKSLSARTTPSKDTKVPYRFTTSGRVSLPGNVAAAQGCLGGQVSVTFRSGKKTISTRRVGLQKNCTYKSVVSFRIPSRLHPKTLEVRVRFLGNTTAGPRSAKVARVRVAL